MSHLKDSVGSQDSQVSSDAQYSDDSGRESHSISKRNTYRSVPNLLSPYPPNKPTLAEKSKTVDQVTGSLQNRSQSTPASQSASADRASRFKFSFRKKKTGSVREPSLPSSLSNSAHSILSNNSSSSINLISYNTLTTNSNQKTIVRFYLHSDRQVFWTVVIDSTTDADSISTRLLPRVVDLVGAKACTAVNIYLRSTNFKDRLLSGNERLLPLLTEKYEPSTGELKLRPADQMRFVLEPIAPINPDVVMCSNILSFLPQYIAHRYLFVPHPPSQPERDEFPSAVMFLDIQNFTQFTETQLLSGDIGLESIADHLNDFFGKVIEVIRQYQGDVIQFGGDSLLMIWQSPLLQLSELTMLATRCALRLHEKFGNYTSREGVHFGLYLVVTAGVMSNMHVGEPGNWQIVFMGDPILQVSHCMSFCEAGQILLSTQAWEQLGVENQTKFAVKQVAPAVRKRAHSPPKKLFGKQTFLRSFTRDRATSRSSNHLLSPLAESDPENPSPLPAQEEVSVSDVESPVALDSTPSISRLGLETSPQERPFILSGIRPSEDIAAPEVAETILSPKATLCLRSYYIAQAVLSNLDDNLIQWIGALRQVTVLFLSLPEISDFESHDFLTRLHKATLVVQTQVKRFNGSINKMIMDDKGTLFLCGFGLPPEPSSQMAIRSVRAALQIVRLLESIQLKCTIGITTGKNFCGLLGSKFRREYTIMGDCVNLAARLMKAAKPILVDTTTYMVTRSQFLYNTIPDLALKGKSVPITAYQPVEVTPVEKTSLPVMIGRSVELNIASELMTKITLASADPALTTSSSSPTCSSTTSTELIDASGSVLLIQGDLGVGKSTLVNAIVTLAKSRDIRVFSSSNDYQFQSKYNPFYHLLLAACKLSEDSPSDHIQETLCSVFKDYAFFFNDLFHFRISDPDGLATIFSPDELFHRTVNLLMPLIQALPFPFMLVLEDIGLMDPVGWYLIEKLHSHCKSVLILATARHFNIKHPACVAVVTSPRTCLLHLEPPSQHDILKIVNARFNVVEIDQRIQELLFVSGFRNPSYTLDIVRLLLEKDVYKINPTTRSLYMISDRIQAKSVSATIQETLRNVLMTHVDRLDPLTQLTLKVASTIGPQFPIKILLKIHPVVMSKAQLQTQIDELIASGCIKEIPKTSTWIVSSSRSRLSDYDMVGNKAESQQAQSSSISAAPATHQVLTSHGKIYQFSEGLCSVCYDSLLFSHRRKLHSRQLEYLETLAIRSDVFLGNMATHAKLADNTQKHLLYLAYQTSIALVTTGAATKAKRRASRLIAALETSKVTDTYFRGYYHRCIALSFSITDLNTAFVYSDKAVADFALVTYRSFNSAYGFMRHASEVLSPLLRRTSRLFSRDPESFCKSSSITKLAPRLEMFSNISIAEMNSLIANAKAVIHQIISGSLHSRKHLPPVHLNAIPDISNPDLSNLQETIIILVQTSKYHPEKIAILLADAALLATYLGYPKLSSNLAQCSLSVASDLPDRSYPHSYALCVQSIPFIGFGDFANAYESLKLALQLSTCGDAEFQTTSRIADLSHYLLALVYIVQAKFLKASLAFQRISPVDQGIKGFIYALNIHMYLVMNDVQKAEVLLPKLIELPHCELRISFYTLVLQARIRTLNQSPERTKNFKYARSDIKAALLTLKRLPALYSIEDGFFLFHLLSAVHEINSAGLSSRGLKKHFDKLTKLMSKLASSFPLLHPLHALVSGILLNNPKKALGIWQDGLQYAQQFNLPVESALLGYQIGLANSDSFLVRESLENLVSAGVLPLS